MNALGCGQCYTCPWWSYIPNSHTHTHARTHARTHTHAHTHTGPQFEVCRIDSSVSRNPSTYALNESGEYISIWPYTLLCKCYTSSAGVWSMEHNGYQQTVTWCVCRVNYGVCVGGGALQTVMLAWRPCESRVSTNVQCMHVQWMGRTAWDPPWTVHDLLCLEKTTQVWYRWWLLQTAITQRRW